MKHRSIRDKIIASALAVALGASGLALSACSMQTTVNTEIDNTAKTAQAGYEVRLDERTTQALVILLNMEYNARVDLQKIKAGEVEGFAYDPDNKVYVATISPQSDDYSPFNADTVTVYFNALSTAAEAMSQRSGENAAMLERLDKAAFKDAELDLTFRYDFKGQEPIETNFSNLGNGIYGADISLKGDQLWALFSGEGLEQLDLPTYYAFFTDAHKTTDAIEINAKKYTSSPAVNISTNGIIDAVAVDGVAKPVSDEAFLGKDGKHVVDVSLSNGNSKKFTTILDTKAPTAKIGGKKVAEGKTIKVKKGAKLVIKEANLKSAKLGGKTIRNKAAVKRAGKLVITDKAGNTLKATVKLVK